jgi:hypothetical protein
LGVLGGFIHKVGLVVTGGSSDKEIDATTTIFNPMGNHSTEKPLSLNYYIPIEYRAVGASDTNATSRQYAEVAGTLQDMAVYVSTNDTDGTRLFNFRVNGVNNLANTISAGTTGSFIELDLNIPFAKGDRLNYRYVNGTATTGNITPQITSVIVWD